MAVSSKTKSQKRQYAIGGLALALTIAACIVVVLYWDYVRQAEHYGIQINPDLVQSIMKELNNQ